MSLCCLSHVCLGLRVCVPGRAGSCSLLPQRRSNASCMSQLQGRAPRPPTTPPRAVRALVLGRCSRERTRGGVFETRLRISTHLNAGRGRGRLDESRPAPHPTSTHRSEAFEVCLFAHQDSAPSSHRSNVFIPGKAVTPPPRVPRVATAFPAPHRWGVSLPLCPPPPPQKPLVTCLLPDHQGRVRRRRSYEDQRVARALLLYLGMTRN